MPDIDIDFADRKSAVESIDAVQAMMVKDGVKIHHPSGAYMQNIPIDPITGIAAFEYKSADKKGFTKIDFLNQSIYNDVRDEDHLIELLITEPPWELLDDDEFLKHITHIGKHADIVRKILPTSISDMAIVLALIRPAKRYLVNEPRHVIENEVWEKTMDGYAFKKAHAISYAALIAVQMNIISEKLLGGTMGDDECIVF